MAYQTYWNDAAGQWEIQTDLPVWMLYDVDPTWPESQIQERVEVVEIFSQAMREVGHPLLQAALDSDNLAELLSQNQPDEVIVFNWLEDVPGFPLSCALAARELENFGFTYTGASASMLAFSQDKRQVKHQLSKSRIPTPVWAIHTSDQGVAWNRFPAIVKPAFEHCSIGITREAVVQTPSELTQRVRYVLEEFRQPALVEEFIDGPEFHVGVVGNGVLQMLPPGEIDYSAFDDIHDRLCTYESNVDPTCLAFQVTKPRLPAELTADQLNDLEAIVTTAYRVTGCRDFARMDVRLRDGIFYVLDVNPNADIGPDTSLAMGAKMAGYSYGQFGSLLVSLAAHRHPLFGKKLG